MEIPILYNGQEVILNIPESYDVEVIEPLHTEKKDCETLLNNAFENPINSPKLEDFLENGKILVVVNDATRPIIQDKVLEKIYPFLENKDVEYLVATGSHKAPTEEECSKIFGAIYEKIKDNVHSNTDEGSEFVEIGTTKNGTLVKINKKALDADKIININTVEPHYFAGFTGGRKSFLPGISAFESIEHNHSFALERDAVTCNLSGNPVNDGMVETLSFLMEKKEIFGINLVLDTDFELYDAYVGDPMQSFLNAVETSKKVHCTSINEKADIVVSIALPPNDMDLYQSQKALDNGKLALKEGGILILAAACNQSIGPSKFFELMKTSHDPQQLLEEIRKGYKLGYHKAAKIMDIATWAEIVTVSNLGDEDLETCFMKPCKGVQEALDSALSEKGESAKVIVLKNGGLTVPLLRTSN